MKYNTYIITNIIHQLYIFIEELETLFHGQYFTPVARLEPFQLVSLSDIKIEEYTEFSVEAFFRSY